MSTLDGTRPLDHLLILASAGSGKTFQLTNRYLRLLVERVHAGHSPPGSILASTFTRLAAGEIRDRVLGRLAKAAVSGEALEELRTMVHPAIDCDMASDLLGRLVRDLHCLQLRTLDSFFANVVQSFSLELGLPSGVRVVDEDEAAAMRREAIGLMLDETEAQRLVDVLRAMSEGRDSRGVMATIESAVDHLYELYCESSPGAWRRIAEPTLASEDAMARATDELAELAAELPDTRMCKAACSDVDRIRAAGHVDYDGWLAVIGKGLAGKLLSGETTYYKKPIPDDLAAAYEPVLQHAVNVMRSHLAWRTNATADLLERFEACYEQVKRRRRAVTFSDLTRRIVTAADRPGFEELCFRLDGRVEHLLLDEMQDTSVLQWQALAPIAQEIASHAPPERTVFVVGDVKQSIYGWRSACPEILEHMPELLSETGDRAMIDTHPLATSYRSAQPVIDAVNTIFRDLPGNEALREHNRAARAWQETFDVHRTARTERPGRVELRTASVGDEGDDGDPKTGRLEEAADCIERLHRANPGGTIGVLVRTGKTANRLLHMLGPTRRGLPATGPGGGSVIDAPPVAAVLDLLRLADHPDHSIAAFNVMHSPLGPVVGLTGDGSSPSRRMRHRVAREVRRSLTRAGYRRTIQPWIEAIISDVDEREAKRLMELLDLAAEYDDRATLRADDFNRFAEARAVRTSRRAPIEVMTIHAAKGLEFTSVVLPDLDQPLLATNRIQAVYERSGHAGLIDRAAARVRSEVWDVLTDLRPMYGAALERMAREALSLLYVAVTRAEQNLFMFINAAKSSEKKIPQTYAGLLRSALAEIDPEPGQVLYETGGHDPFAGPRRDPMDGRLPEVPADADADAARPAGVNVQPGAAPAVAQPPSAGEGEADAGLFLLDRVEARDHGSAIHYLFEQIGWLDVEDGRPAAPDRRTLLALLRTRWPRYDGAWHEQVVETFLSHVQCGPIADLLTPDGSNRTVHRERRFARRTEDGSLQVGVIDRLELERDEHGAVTAACIVDWKTDRVTVDDVQQRAREHAPQMRSYADAVAGQYGLPDEAVSVRLAFVVPGIVVDPLADSA